MAKTLKKALEKRAAAEAYHANVVGRIERRNAVPAADWAMEFKPAPVRNLTHKLRIRAPRPEAVAGPGALAMAYASKKALKRSASRQKSKRVGNKPKSKTKSK